MLTHIYTGIHVHRHAHACIRTCTRSQRHAGGSRAHMPAPRCPRAHIHPPGGHAVVTPRPRPLPSAAPQLRDVHGLHSRLSTDLRRRLERARTRGAFFCSRWGVFVANPSTQRREHERKFRPCHRVEQDGGPGLEGPLPRASRTPPGVRASRPSPPSDLECPPWPAAGGLSRGRHRTSAAGRTARSRACDLAICEDRVFLQEPRWAVREPAFRASQGGGARASGAVQPSAEAEQSARPAWGPVRRGGPKHQREAPCSDSGVPADRRPGQEGPPPPAVTSRSVCTSCPAPSTPAPYGDAQEPGNGSRGLRPRGRANAHA